MIAEDLEFQISQYVDGTLSAAQTSRIEALLKADPQARKVLADYQLINSHLGTMRDLPDVRWDEFAGHISRAIDAAVPEVTGRIGFTAWAGRLRIAAAVLIVTTVGLVVRHGMQHSALPGVDQSKAVSEVTGPSAEIAVGTPTEDVSVAPSALARGEGGVHYADVVTVPGPSKIVISQAMNSKPAPKSLPH